VLQFLGSLFEYILSKKEGKASKLTIIGATSGDTGSSAIHGVRGKAGIDCFILYPHVRA
jgi:threonine synthase